jgi:hypothetical protein
MKPFVFLAGAVLAVAQTQIKPIVTQRTVNEQVNIVRLSPRYSTAIRLPEAVSSVVVGDPVKFLAEHSDKEPTLVLVKPASEDAAESNLLVTTVKGTHLSFLLRSEGPSARAPVDFVMNYRSAGSFLVEDSAVGTGEVAGTTELAPSRPAAALSPGPSAVIRSTRVQTDGAIELPERDGLAMLLERQQRAKLPPLYGMRTATPDGKGDLVKVGISEVVDQGGEVVVLFSIVNPQAHAIEILPPQIQLAGKLKKGFPIKRSHWGTSQQFPVRDFRLARRRIGSGERTDGVVVFARPSFKQSNETLFLQIAESGAVDKPALAPIGFGVSAVRKEMNHGK